MVRTKTPTELYIAELPDAYGYGIVAFGETPEEAEKLCRLEYRRHNHGPGTGWHAQPWKEAKENWGFSIERAVAGTAHLGGNGDYVLLT